MEISDECTIWQVLYGRHLRSASRMHIHATTFVLLQMTQLKSAFAFISNLNTSRFSPEKWASRTMRIALVCTEHSWSGIVLNPAAIKLALSSTFQKISIQARWFKMEYQSILAWWYSSSFSITKWTVAEPWIPKTGHLFPQMPLVYHSC